MDTDGLPAEVLQPSLPEYKKLMGRVHQFCMKARLIERRLCELENQKALEDDFLAVVLSRVCLELAETHGSSVGGSRDSGSVVSCKPLSGSAGYRLVRG